jgi:MFS superfamily sulfate permease-like transporter
MIFKPKLVTLLKNNPKEFNLNRIIADINAGLIVAFIAIPLSIAFGIAFGVMPGKGLVTAIVAGFLISLFSGSRVQIGGPTGAFVIMSLWYSSKLWYKRFSYSNCDGRRFIDSYGFFKIWGNYQIYS